MKNTLPILLVEDDKVDQMTVKRGLFHLKMENELIIKQNGLEALEYLNDKSNTRPGIILLDLNMPKMNGIEFLHEVKKDASHQLIPVIVMTTSTQDQDRIDSFQEQASGYMVKPVDYPQFLNTLKTICTYWLTSEIAHC
ncbi:two-component system response regulator [Reichenbachiella sp. 5M10]|uniref:response regulator n=1 Tax=Reichenbachiella sp. 5M10 TaxID=1889772 RepID=UPI000C152621|nr:response regulator [Reichenbachiella sp. 5M10]PIB34732.1 two-component system response regulator [Reichenbachiella sp. 5M10]